MKRSYQTEYHSCINQWAYNKHGDLPLYPSQPDAPGALGRCTQLPPAQTIKQPVFTARYVYIPYSPERCLYHRPLTALLERYLMFHPNQL